MSIVASYIEGLGNCLKELSRQDIEGIADTIFAAYEKGRRIFIMGNGGSAATASHFARDLAIGTRAKDKPRIQAVSLADSAAMITALANDVDYASIFREQLIGHVQKGDVSIGISASGNSPNVLNGIEYARGQGAVTIGLIGFGGGKLKALSDKSIVLSSRDYGQVEDIHMALAHMIAYILREKLEQHSGQD
jgi:D-sedoheptulose 7-phosphate isomerase